MLQDKGIIVCINVMHHRQILVFLSKIERPNFGFFSNDQILASDRQTDRQTDGQTDRQTDRQTDAINIFWAFLVKN